MFQVTNPDRPNGRRTGGFSLARALVENMGVTTREGVLYHVGRAYERLLADPTFDVTTYRDVNPANPNNLAVT